MFCPSPDAMVANMEQFYREVGKPGLLYWLPIGRLTKPRLWRRYWRERRMALQYFKNGWGKR